jgi:hypothetical protein
MILEHPPGQSEDLRWSGDELYKARGRILARFYSSLNDNDRLLLGRAHIDIHRDFRPHATDQRNSTSGIG